MGQESVKHIESLDGLRGVAILLVFFFHYLPRNPHNPLSWIASLGWTGVDLFFVLSGFLITGILYDTRQSSNFFQVFYARRALRLFPLYFLAVGLVLFVAGLLHIPTGWKAILFYTYGANILLGLGNWAPNFTPYFNCVHFWSLAHKKGADASLRGRRTRFTGVPSSPDTFRVFDLDSLQRASVTDGCVNGWRYAGAGRPGEPTGRVAQT
jgi:hypothetical protein